MKRRLSAPDKLKFAKAKLLSREHNISGVVEVMLELSASYPENAKIRAVLANAYWDLGEIASSESEFRKAVEFSPTLEIASLGLFHCLWEQGRRDEAFDEMKRFMALSDSVDYRGMVEEITRTS